MGGAREPGDPSSPRRAQLRAIPILWPRAYWGNVAAGQINTVDRSRASTRVGSSSGWRCATQGVGATTPADATSVASVLHDWVEDSLAATSP